MKFKNLSYYLLSIFINSSLYAVCDPSDQACLTAPEGILAGNAKATQVVGYFNWMLMSAGISGSVIFGIKTAKKLSDEQWGGAIGPMLGSAICGGMTFIAYSFIK